MSLAMINSAHTEITKVKGKEYAPNVHELNQIIMGYMKWVKGLMDTGRHTVLRQKYDEAIKCDFKRVEFDNSNMDIKFVEAVLDFIDKNDDAHQSTKNEIL